MKLNHFVCSKCGMVDSTEEVVNESRECFMCVKLKQALSKLSDDDLARLKKGTEDHIRKYMHRFVEGRNYIHNESMGCLEGTDDMKTKFLDYKVGDYYEQGFEYLKHKLNPRSIEDGYEDVALYMEKIVINEIMTNEPVFYPTAELVERPYLGHKRKVFDI